MLHKLILFLELARLFVIPENFEAIAEKFIRNPGEKNLK